GVAPGRAGRVGLVEEVAALVAGELVHAASLVDHADQVAALVSIIRSRAAERIHDAYHPPARVPLVPRDRALPVLPGDHEPARIISGLHDRAAFHLLVHQPVPVAEVAAHLPAVGDLGVAVGVVVEPHVVDAPRARAAVRELRGYVLGEARIDAARVLA